MSGYTAIETAPKDGSLIIGFHPHYGYILTSYKKINFSNQEVGFFTNPKQRHLYNEGLQPTKWHPLPKINDKESSNV